jgi:hypothetical protein
MSDNIITGIVALLTAIIGIAILAALVSKSANTAGVISSASSGFSGILKSALGPITGSTNSSLANPINFNGSTGGLESISF